MPLKVSKRALLGCTGCSLSYFSSPTGDEPVSSPTIRELDIFPSLGDAWEDLGATLSIDEETLQSINKKSLAMSRVELDTVELVSARVNKTEVHASFPGKPFPSKELDHPLCYFSEFQPEQPRFKGKESLSSLLPPLPGGATTKDDASTVKQELEKCYKGITDLETGIHGLILLVS